MKNGLLYNAMRKYGSDKFFYELVEDVSDDDSLDDRETYWISFFDCLAPNGYNILSGSRFFKDDNPMYHDEIRKKVSEHFVGDKNPAKRPEVRAKISYSASGKTASEETRLKMSINNVRYWKGKKIPQYIIEAHANKLRTMTGALNKTSKRIGMFSMDMTFIREFAGAEEAARFIATIRGNADGSNISRTACGKQKSAYGYLWKYL